ncbi:methyltransferase domain-containing protein [Hymenobacter sp. BT507]|uniref:Methyltransferase domain-containing protein n=1 Tax=Hymenobacter citatus TaxID=2763506 RepID=A0ABR7MQ21_9BACT|nr:class I SAM-dependent methyltransferase [Hymenobacter citatus]MBC6612657.1 methyltransferase domain-containing protein [Hymenobacter citatus]
MPPLDRFSLQAAQYAQYRINYPRELYTDLLAGLASRQRAWDCATGNGQVATALAEHFAQVDATDSSAAQLANAALRPNITYQVVTAEATPFADNTFDLITVGQAAHWFDFDRFNNEAQRVARPRATVAEWGYQLAQVQAELNPVLAHFYAYTMRPYWDENRWHIDDQYARIPFPFAQVQHRTYHVRRSWTAAWFLKYLRTWSSVVKYEQQHGTDPVLAIEEEVTQRWGAGEREVVFPVFLRQGIVDK